MFPSFLPLDVEPQFYTGLRNLVIWMLLQAVGVRTVLMPLLTFALLFLMTLTKLRGKSRKP
jgi:hypothetical protein